jgi:hypothetical protein
MSCQLFYKLIEKNFAVFIHSCIDDVIYYSYEAAEMGFESSAS